MTGGSHKLVGFPKVGTGAGAPGAGALAAGYTLHQRRPLAVSWPRQRTDEWLSNDRLSEGPSEVREGGQADNLLLPLCGLRLSCAGRQVPGHLRADNDAAVGDAGPIPACPELGVLAPVLEEDVADARRVI